MLINPESDEELAHAVRFLATDDDLRLKMSAAGKAHAAKFRWEDAVEKTLAVYRELV